MAREQKIDTLEHIVARMNELFAGELSDDDRLNYATTIKDKVMENEKVAAQLKTNSKEQAMLGDFPVALTEAVVLSLDAHKSMATQVLSTEQIKEGFARLVLDMIYRDLQRQPEEL